MSKRRDPNCKCDACQAFLNSGDSDVRLGKNATDCSPISQAEFDAKIERNRRYCDAQMMRNRK